VYGDKLRYIEIASVEQLKKSAGKVNSKGDCANARFIIINNRNRNHDLDAALVETIL
jgi:hypothetical protein